VLKEHSELIAEEATLIVTGKVSDKDGQLKLLANAVARFSPEALDKAPALEQRTWVDRPAPDAPAAGAPAPAPAALTPPPPGSLELMLEQAFSVDKLRELKSCLSGLPTGTAPVLLRVREGSRERRIKTNFKIAINPAIRARLEEIVGSGRVQG